MTAREKRALAAEARRDMENDIHGLDAQQWVTLLNCYSHHVSAQECAALLRKEARMIRAIYLNLSLVSLRAMLQDTADACTAAGV